MEFPPIRAATLYSTSSTLLGLAWRAFSPAVPSVAVPSLHRPAAKSPDSLAPSTPPPIRRSTSQMELRFSTSCSACGEKVSLDVPKWIADSVELAQNRPSCREQCHEYGFLNQDGERAKEELRSLVVDGAVSFAHAVKASPILPILFAMLQALVALVVYLNARFALRERAASAVIEVAMGLVEIEKELGLFRNAGEGLSIVWEAFVKGTIALAKSEPPRPRRGPEPAPMASTNQLHPHTRLDSFDHTAYRDEPISPMYSGSPQYREYPSVDFDDGRPPTSIATSRRSANLAPSSHGHSLRRTPLSSPVLRTSYLSSGSSTPSHNLNEARPAFPISSRDSHYPPSYSHVESDCYEFGTDPRSHRRSLSGPADISQDVRAKRECSSWPARTMLGWADRLLSRAESLQHRD